MDSTSTPVQWTLPIPRSAAEIARMQSERRRLAVERARRSALPVLTKEELRSPRFVDRRA
ncbi:MAG: hypothetical protein ACT4P4_20030 [Betaproteobacteria bacterium]